MDKPLTANGSEIFEIWPSDTGITDLPEGWKTLAVTTVADIIPVWADYRKKLENSDQLRTFNQRLAREWAIETGVIEDVFHIDRGTTITLIEQGLSAALIEHGTTNKPPEYVINILRDHVEALDWLLESFVVGKLPLTTARIKELQALLTAHQSYVDAYVRDPGSGALGLTRVSLLRGVWKEQPNNAERDGRQFRYCPPLHTKEQMAKLVEWHNRHQLEGVSPEVEAAWLHHRFTQIHPFHDGNGRVARALASLVFIQAGLFPLVIERGEMCGCYITALEEADAGNLRPLIEVFAEGQRSRVCGALSITNPDNLN
jgi:Fic family protein